VLIVSGLHASKRPALPTGSKLKLQVNSNSAEGIVVVVMKWLYVSISGTVHVYHEGEDLL
jgi:hypothetical protein